jgi:hypothetical protein
MVVLPPTLQSAHRQPGRAARRLPQKGATMRPSILVLALLTVLGLAGAGLAGASQRSGGQTPSGTTIRLHETITTLAHVDVGPRGLSVGDEAVYRLRIRTLDGQPAGWNYAVCTVLAPVSLALTHCVGTGVLPNGRIDWAGNLGLHARHLQFSITGGTGAYRAVRGEIFVRYTNPPRNTRVLVTIHTVD